MLFIFGQVLRIKPTSRRASCNDLQRLFPATEQDTLDNVIDRIRDSSTTIGIVAAIGALWIGASFWGAMDTAFCRIYHVECRGWVEQKRFSFVMLLVVVALPRRERRRPGGRGRRDQLRRQPPLRPLRPRRASTALLLIGGALAVTFADLLRHLLGRPEGPHALARPSGPARCS